MDIVKELGSVAGFGAKIFEDRRNGIDIELFVEGRSSIAIFRPVSLSFRDEATATVAFTILDTNVAVAVGKGFLQPFETLLLGFATLMIVDRNTVARFPAEQAVNRQASSFTFNVPERHIHGSEDVVIDGTVAPIRAHLRGLPKILYTIGILPNEPRLEMTFKRGDDGSSLVIIVGAANTVKARLACHDFDEDPTVAASGTGCDDF